MKLGCSTYTALILLILLLLAVHQKASASTSPSPWHSRELLLPNNPKPATVRWRLTTSQTSEPRKPEPQDRDPRDTEPQDPDPQDPESHKSIEFQLRLPVCGHCQWLLFGFAEDFGQFELADAVLLNLTSGVWRDGTITADGDFREDLFQNWLLEGYHLNASNTAFLALKRPLDTKDAEDYVIDNGTTHLLLAIGSSKFVNVNIANVTKATMPVSLLRNVETNSNLLDSKNAFTMDITVKQVAVPSAETTYWCHVSVLPKFKSNVHIIGYEAVIQPDNKDVVHHMEVYHCGEEGSTKGRSSLKHPLDFRGTCSPENLPPPIRSCKRVLAAWAMGAEPLFYPKEVGTLLSASDDYPYVMVEIHYNNPTHRKGIIDSSGIRFYLTPNLVPFDGGILEVGVIYNDAFAIPPSQFEFQWNGYCTPECTDAGIPEEGITIFASQLHAHLTGKKLVTKHFRHGKELFEVNRDNHFTTHYQEIRQLSQPIKFLPGDMLTTTCLFRTKERRNITMSGLGIRDEMCVNYLHYYPKMSLSVCKSTIGSTSVLQFLKAERQRSNNMKPLSAYEACDMSFHEAYKSINWTTDTVSELKLLYSTSVIDVQCLKGDGSPQVQA